MDWFRPANHPYKAGRPGTFVEPGRDAAGNLNLGGYIDDYVPAGHTFASMHDSLVGILTNNSIPDWLANIPTMPAAYAYAFTNELLNSAFKISDNDLFHHNLEDDFDYSCR